MPPAHYYTAAAAAVSFGLEELSSASPESNLYAPPLVSGACIYSAFFIASFVARRYIQTCRGDLAGVSGKGLMKRYCALVDYTFSFFREEMYFDAHGRCARVLFDS